MPQSFSIAALVAGSDYKALAAQAIKFNAKLAVVANEKHFADLKELLAGTSIEVAAGKSGVELACDMDHSLVIAAIVGMQGLPSLYRSIRPGVDIALANKESLVCAGTLIKKRCHDMGSAIIPVDSEHNAIFQVFDNKQRSSIDSITITASGGPFRGYSLQELEGASVERALKHPNWVMGKKITIDSATMFNKGLEIIEAHHLFDLQQNQIHTVIHPESIVHGFVNYKDGSSLAHFGSPDMRVAINYCLHWPNRYSGTKQIVGFADLARKQTLTFQEYDRSVFTSIDLARQSLISGRSAPCILNAANEMAVDDFLNGKIRFTEIFKVVERALSKHHCVDFSTTEDVLALDKEFRQKYYEAA